MQKVIRLRCLAVLVRIDMEHGLRADTSNAQDQKRADALAKMQAHAPVFCILMLDCSLASYNPDCAITRTSLVPGIN